MSEKLTDEEIDVLLKHRAQKETNAAMDRLRTFASRHCTAQWVSLSAVDWAIATITAMIEQVSKSELNTYYRPDGTVDLYGPGVFRWVTLEQFNAMKEQRDRVMALNSRLSASLTQLRLGYAKADVLAEGLGTASFQLAEENAALRAEVERLQKENKQLLTERDAAREELREVNEWLSA
jgi:hypothetical protein